ncbi:uncharacterized protein LOC134446429 [Engraulis encrasicolus]|uniref:uncharacterized protein LOC134446429 n=1 Tax=Engraulis encrasicolus TaxID=184585 RepID=UPI002FD10852
MKVKKRTETLRSSAGGVPHISDMRIVLLGYRTNGKSSCGNTILGRQEFQTPGRTAECVKREGETADRHITIVEAPGQWVNPVEHIPERVKREIVLSVSLCPPGPHALLLVIRPDESFPETRRRGVQELLELLGERVWNHTIVLFTYGDCLGDTSIEQHIENGGEALQWVVEKCGNSYHVYNKKRGGDQVTELLEKIEEMVTVNNGHHFGFENNMMITLTENKKEENKRAEQRRMKVQTQRNSLRSSADMRIVLLGGSAAGKSSCGNTILGRQEFQTAGRTAECVKREGETADRHITVVEAPGQWINPVEHIPERVKREIVLSVSLCPPGPHALLLVLRADASLSETDRRVVQGLLELLGDRVWSHTLVLFTYGDCLGDTSIEQHIENGGEALQWLVGKCGNRYHVLDNEKRDGGQVTELLEKIEEMVMVNSGPHALLLVLRADSSITDSFRRGLQECLELLGERVWSHTIVLFTKGDCLGNTSIEQHIESGGQALQWLVGKCDNRYHVLDNEKSDVGQVEELLEKIEEMVMLNSDMRIVLLGYRTNGKSSCGNTILGRQEFQTPGRTAECVKREGETADRHITVVEAPGNWESPPELAPERVKQDIILSVSLCPPGPHALLLVLRADASLSETRRRGVQELLELLGERVWNHTIVLFTRGDWLGDTSIEQHIESEGETLQWVVEKCCNRYHVLDNAKRDGDQVTELLEKIEEMVAINSGENTIGDFPNFSALPDDMPREDSSDVSAKSSLKTEITKPLKKVKSTEEIVLPGNFGEGIMDDRPSFSKANPDDFSRGDDSASALQTGVMKPRKLLSITASIQRSGAGAGAEESRGAAEVSMVMVPQARQDGGAKRTEVTTGEWRSPLKEGVSEANPDDFSRGDSAYDSASALQTGVMKPRKLLSITASIQRSGVGAADAEESRGSAEVSMVMVSEANPDDFSRGDSVFSSALQPDLKTAGFTAKDPFVDISKITFNATECIGKGSYGVVYRGSYQGTPAAVKIITTGNNPAVTNEFIIPWRLSHPNIVRMMAVAKSETQILIANEYIHGANLQEVLHTDTPIKLQQEDKLLVALDLAMAVEYIHGKNIIHQDLKPANIMVAAVNKQAYLTDWGLANLMETVTMSTAGSPMGAFCGALGGTPQYMAPECLVECDKCSTMSDMWSLGITLLEMFTDSKPWTYTTVQELRKLLHKKKDPPALSKLQPPLRDIVKPLIKYTPRFRKNANDLARRKAPYGVTETLIEAGIRACSEEQAAGGIELQDAIGDVTTPKLDGDGTVWWLAKPTARSSDGSRPSQPQVWRKATAGVEESSHISGPAHVFLVWKAVHKQARPQPGIGGKLFWSG